MKEHLTRIQQHIRSNGVNALFIMGLRLATLVAKFVLTIFIAHSMGFEELGLYGLVVGATVVGTTVAGLGLMNLIVRDVVSVPVTQIPVVMRQYWLLPTTFYVLALPVSLIIGAWQNLLCMAIFTWALVIIEHLNADAYGLLLSRYRARAANMLFFIRSAGWIFLFVPMAWCFPILADIYVVLMLWFLANVIALIIFFHLTRDWSWPKTIMGSIDFNWHKSHLSQSWMFYISDICGMAGLYMDRYLITMFLGLEKTGIYVLFWSVGNAIYGLISTGALQTKRPHLIAAYQNKDFADYRSTYREIIAVAFVTAFILVGVSGTLFPLLLPYLDKPAATAYVPLLWVLLMGVLARVAADVSSYGLYVRRFDKAFTLSNIMVLPLTALLLPICIHVGGLYGAAFAGFLALTIQCLVRIYTTQLILRKTSGADNKV